MTTQNTLREISKILYQLKKDFGLKMSVRIFEPSTYTFDVRTGREEVNYTDYTIKRGIVLPLDFARKFSYDLSYIAANKNFTYGGFYDEGTRFVIIEIKDIPQGVVLNLEDQIGFDDRAYTIKDIVKTEVNKGLLIELKQLSSESDIAPAPPPSNLWTPADIATQAWYDAADASTIIATVDRVNQWDDKSGNALNAIQNTFVRQPQTGATTINGLNTLRFAGLFMSEFMGTASNPFNPSVVDAHVFQVLKTPAVLVNGVNFSLTGVLNPTTSRWEGRAPYSTSVRFDAGVGQALSFGSIAPSEELMISFYGSATESVQQVWKDGSLLVGNTNSNTATTAGNISIGGYLLGPYQRFELGEMVILNGTVTTATRQLMEGYLAWKWGLEGDLPIGHPYKNAAPTI